LHSKEFQAIDFDSLEAVARQRDSHMFEVCNFNATLFRGLRRMLDQVSREDLLQSWLNSFKEYFPKYHTELVAGLGSDDFESRKAKVQQFVEVKAAKNTKWLRLFRESVDSMM
jgi:hypothetical protein